MSKFWVSCTSFLLKMDDKKGINPLRQPADDRGSDTSRTEIDHEALSLSRPTKQRIKWMEHFRKYRNARLTCRHFGISPDTFYLWRKRFNPDNLQTLEDDFKTRKPHRMRPSKHQQAQLETIRRLKEVNPRIGKIRITKILKELDYSISPATVTRITRIIRTTRPLPTPKKPL